eukprot:CAMPEP_0198268614 /NCGR_PEP_ID=MMETSP1447-20131203/37954_1 /TAXON_ID=420782 /ORGANISM="Chaetoceros dichaeta, Strain CCMP1751" /LENGTH=103 /DNA_ID=CAMNT_0043959755 /DNA_START=11 /DNA_END=318 /DNA_ORIENTATION=+
MIRLIPVSLYLSILLVQQHVTPVTSNRAPNLDEPFQDSFHQLSQTACVTLFSRDKRIGCGTQSRDNSKGTLLHWSTLAETSEDSYASSLPSFVAVLEEGEYTS